MLTNSRAIHLYQFFTRLRTTDNISGFLRATQGENLIDKKAPAGRSCRTDAIDHIQMSYNRQYQHGYNNSLSPFEHVIVFYVVQGPIGFVEPLNIQLTMKPVIIKTQARSGSTLLMQLLQRNPDIVIPNIYPFEIRIAQYWSAAFRVLSGEADFDHSSRPNFFHRDLGEYWIGRNPFKQYSDRPSQKWLNTEYTNKLHDFFAECTFDYYSQLAKDEKKTPKYFVEKAFYISNGPMQQDANVIFDLFTDQVKLIFLVREPKDILCSNQAFFRDSKSNASDLSSKIKNLATHMNNMASDYVSEKETNDTCIIHYEDMMSSRIETLNKIWSWLDVAEQSSDVSTNNIPNKHRTSTSDGASIGRWKNELSREMASLADQEFEQYRETFGYH